MIKAGRATGAVPGWIWPLLLSLGSYLTLGLCSSASGRLSLGVWWGVQAAGWISGAWFLQTVRSGWPTAGWIVASALAFRVCGLWFTPTLEDDYQRYLWDGWRTIQNGSPYDHPPAEFFARPEIRPAGIEAALNEINHPDLTTIYAPVTQLLFAAAAAIAPGSLVTLKLLLLLADGLLMLLLLAFGGKAAAWFYGWCPLVVTEVGFHAHPEGWALLWLVAAYVCARRERYLWAGALAGVAVGAKLFALLAVPFLVWRRPAIALPAFLAALGLIYAPFLASGSTAEWAGLHAMASYFEFNSLGYSLLLSLCGSKGARGLWPFLFGAVAVLLFARWVSQKRGLAQAPVCAVLLAFFLLSPVVNPWYLIWLVPFVVLTPNRPAIALLVAAPLSYTTGLNLGSSTLATYGQPAWVRLLEIGTVLLAAFSNLWWRRQPLPKPLGDG